mgnify:CR=1 FL=1
MDGGADVGRVVVLCEWLVVSVVGCGLAADWFDTDRASSQCPKSRCWCPATCGWCTSAGAQGGMDAHFGIWTVAVM